MVQSDASIFLNGAGKKVKTFDKVLTPASVAGALTNCDTDEITSPHGGVRMCGAL